MRWQAIASILEPPFVIGQRRVGSRRPVRLCRRVGGRLPAQLFHAFADRREIVGGAESGYSASLNWAEADTVRAGEPGMVLDQIVLNRPETGKYSARRTIRGGCHDARDADIVAADPVDR